VYEKQFEALAESHALMRVGPNDHLIGPHEHQLFYKAGLKRPGRKPKQETLELRALKVSVHLGRMVIVGNYVLLESLSNTLELCALKVS
jgi:hypothetical protein